MPTKNQSATDIIAALLSIGEELAAVQLDICSRYGDDDMPAYPLMDVERAIKLTIGEMLVAEHQNGRLTLWSEDAKIEDETNAPAAAESGH